MNYLLLFIWIAIGIGLRFTQLTLKSPWTDEFATMIFSLGNTYQTVPLDQAISLETLLQPLKLNSSVGVSAVIHHLLTEDHHPPLYFVFAHWWIQLFSIPEGYVSLWVARSLPAFLGVLSIPAVYGLGWLAFRSQLIAQLAAAMMAVSPYGIYLAQEARHYTLGILWVIASLSCLVVALQHLQHRILLPIWIALCWIIINSLGIATHYFFSLTLCAEAIVLIGFWLSTNPLFQKIFPTPHSPLPTPPSYWSRIYIVIVATCVAGLLWLPVWQNNHDPQMMQWIQTSDRTFITWIAPIFQALAAWITMISLLPVEASSLLIVIPSGIIMIGFFVWAIPIFYSGIKAQLKNPKTRLQIKVLGGFVLGAIALFFGITYIIGTDLTRGARYNFLYFPAVIVLVATALAVIWNNDKNIDSELQFFLLIKNPKSQISNLKFPNILSLKTNGKQAVAIIWVMGFVSGITVVSNLGYQKYYRPDFLVPMIQNVSSVPVLMATTHNTLVQTGEMMGLGWEFKRSAKSKLSQKNPQFLLAHQDEEECEKIDCPASKILQQTLSQLPRPLDVWLVNFKAPVVDPLNCFAEDISEYPTSVDGYHTKLYHCLEDDT